MSVGKWPERVLVTRPARVLARSCCGPALRCRCLGTCGRPARWWLCAVVTVVAHAGGSRAPMPPAGDWGALADRLIAGEVCALFAWGFYKLGSQKIILARDAMRILTWGAVWTVGRDEVERVLLAPSSLTIMLCDGSRIRPSMFWSSPTGMALAGGDIFANFSSRKTIFEQIMRWRRPPAGDTPTGVSPAGRALPRAPRWRVRGNFLLLVTLIAVAAEAVLVTAFVWPSALMSPGELPGRCACGGDPGGTSEAADPASTAP
jgi:hypothetical protein